MKRRKLIKAISALFLGTWAPSWTPNEIISTDSLRAKKVFDPTMLDTPLKKIFLEHMREVPQEYSRWLGHYGHIGTY